MTKHGKILTEIYSFQARWRRSFHEVAFIVINKNNNKNKLLIWELCLIFSMLSFWKQKLLWSSKKGHSIQFQSPKCITISESFHAFRKVRGTYIYEKYLKQMWHSQEPSQQLRNCDLKFLTPGWSRLF